MCKPHIQKRAVSRALENTQNSVKTPCEKKNLWASSSVPSSPELPPLSPCLCFPQYPQCSGLPAGPPSPGPKTVSKKNKQPNSEDKGPAATASLPEGPQTDSLRGPQLAAGDIPQFWRCFWVRAPSIPRWRRTWTAGQAEVAPWGASCRQKLDLIPSPTQSLRSSNQHPLPLREQRTQMAASPLGHEQVLKT